VTSQSTADRNWSRLRVTLACTVVIATAAVGPFLSAQVRYPTWVCATVSVNLATWLAFALDHAGRRGREGALPAAFLVLFAWCFGGLGASAGALAFSTRRRGFVIVSVLTALAVQAVLVALTIARMPARL
jgi:uncharacterized membrane protein YsdA (DUF1294 family)